MHMLPEMERACPYKIVKEYEILTKHNTFLCFSNNNYRSPDVDKFLDD